MKVSDAVALWLRDKGIKTVFTVSGGADLHLIHSIWKTNGLKIFCPQNEQAAGFMADAVARLKGIGCALATSGPGATNLFTPIATSYYDSIPVIYITGNQTRERMKTFGTRQYGFQACPIVEMATPVTKWAKTVNEPGDVIPSLEEAFDCANRGRKGPVLIDFPDDVQRANV